MKIAGVKISTNYSRLRPFDAIWGELMTVSERDTQALAGVLTDAEYPELPAFQRGKVRDSYDLPDGRRIMIATDRQSAFDKVLAAVPYKGQVLTQTARFWFDQTEDICPNHVIDYPDPNVILAKTLKILPIEMVVRDYMTGSTETSIWPMYERGERLLYGHQFIDGLVKNQKLPETIITPTTKAEAGEHDAPITAVEIVEQGLLTQEQWDDVSAKSLAVFARGREIAARNGLILVDTKFEFGLDENGTIILADEILTPDSSRYWKADSYETRLSNGEEPESLDKEFLRLWVRGQCDPYKDPIPDIPPETLIEFAGKYVALFETVTGLSFDYGDPAIAVRDRAREALVRSFPDYF
jgi:phosphoribosylaminoimidazole-succinocarboxamide synthase